MLSWSRRRQLIYLGGVILFFSLAALSFYLWTKPRPSCEDNIKNQKELGVDCGGPCSRACPAQIVPLKVFWSRPVKVRQGVYDVVAQVENKNLNFGVRQADYRLEIFDAANKLIAKREGKTFINPNEKFLIFEGGIKTYEAEAKTAFLFFSPDLNWEKVGEMPRNVYIERREFTNLPRPRLHLKVTNNSLEDISGISVVAVLSDLNQTALGSSASLLERLRAGESQDLYLTWPEPLPTEPSYFDWSWRINTFEI